MQPTCIHIILHRPNETALLATPAARKDAGERDPKIAKSLAKSIARHSAHKVDASDRSHVSAVIYSALAGALAPHKKTA